MSTKSDFAQKLLLDLRLRKERMGVNQSSTHSNTTGRDAYRSTGNMQRGSRQTKSLESIGGSKTMNQQLVPSRGSNRALAIKESSQQIVSYAGGAHRRSESMGDLSMAFCYDGKLLNIGDILQQIGQKSLNIGNSQNKTMATSSLVKHHPSNEGTLTTIQIKEISKGVKNLYEIIRSSSNGANVDKYSMEVGKELLKGAKGLEESLRMLVNLQEASEMMVSPQRKSRVTLLEVDEENEDYGSKTIDRDRNQVALPRFSFDNKKPSKKSNLGLIDASSKLPMSHRRSESCDVESVKSVSAAKNNSTHPEKGRISNVIAKLMGLEEVPLKDDLYSKQEDNKKVEDSNINVAYKISRPLKKDGLVSLNDRNSQQNNDSNRSTVCKASRPMKDGQVSLYDQKSQQIEDSNTDIMSRLKQSNNKNNQSDRVPEKLYDQKSQQVVDSNTDKVSRLKQSSNKKNQSDRVPEKQERKTIVETKEKIQQKRRNTEVALRVDKKKTIRVEKSNEIKLVPRNNKIQEPEKKTQKNKQYSQQIKQVIKHTNSPAKEPKKQPVEQNPKAKDSTPTAQEVNITECLVQPPAVKEKHVPPKKIDSMVVRKIEAPRTKDDVLKKSNRTDNTLLTPSEHKLSVLKQMKSKGVAIENQSLNSKKAESTIRFDDIVPICEDDIKTDPQLTSEIIVAGSSEIIKETAIVSQNKPKKAFNFSIQVVLTEHEKQLKEILIKDQLFLSTAQALFKLNIPVGFLHADDHNHRRDETKLKLDCGYEILKRKARSQELSSHPYLKPSISGMTIRLLDELVKQLYKDLECLRLYGRNAHNEYDEADYLHHMLQRDINNTNPDVNSFWDFGWHITTLTFVEKDEFVHEVEEEVLHLLVDEIIDDLLNMSSPF